jgi:hypothetical protein
MRRWGTPPPPQEAGRKTGFSQKFDERFFVGASVAHPNEKAPFEGCGASHHSPQTAMIELTFIQVGSIKGIHD